MNGLKAFLSFFFLCFSTLQGLENSIVPAMELAEELATVPQDKYSKNQWAEIVEALQQKERRLRVVSFNMLANDADDKRETFNRWPKRLPRIVATLNEMMPDLISTQELYQNQLDELYPSLESAYGFYAQPRTDGELNGVFYRKSRFELLLAKTWAIPQTGKLGNTVTMLQLRDKRTGHIFAIFNTHLAFGANEREQEVAFILEKITPIAKAMPVFLTGDLNTFPHRLDERFPYYDGDYTHRQITKEIFKDASEVSLLGHLGPLSTFTNKPGSGIPFQGHGTPGVMLDHIYVSKEITVLIHAVQPATIDHYFPSDHMPVIIDCFINN